VQVITAKYMTV